MSLQNAVRKALNEKILPQKINDSLSLVIRLLDEIKELKPDEAIRRVLGAVNYMEYIKQYSNLIQWIILQERKILNS